MKHTPGPWFVNGLSAYGWRIGERQELGMGGPANPIALVASRDTLSPRVFPEGEGFANARLIAAAPELLEALKEAICIARTFHGSPGWEIYEQHSPEMKRLLALIAKAEGRQQEE